MSLSFKLIHRKKIYLRDIFSCLEFKFEVIKTFFFNFFFNKKKAFISIVVKVCLKIKYRPIGIVKRMASQLMMSKSSSSSSSNQQRGSSTKLSSQLPQQPLPQPPISLSTPTNTRKNNSRSSTSLVVPLYTPLYSQISSSIEPSSNFNRLTPLSSSTLGVTSSSSRLDSSNQTRSRSSSLQFRGNFQVEETENGIKIQIKHPHLISVRNDANNSVDLTQTAMNKTSIKIYPLKVGRTTVGSCSGNDILVNGRGIESEHCLIENTQIMLNDDTLTSGECCFIATLYPLAKLCAVDGVLIDSPYVLSTGSLFS